MKADLNLIKEMLKKDGVVNEVIHYEGEGELAINEDYFIYNQETGESDLYYIGITIKNNRYVVTTHFCEGDFLEKYDNKEDYIRKFIKIMNLELEVKNLMLA